MPGLRLCTTDFARSSSGSPGSPSRSTQAGDAQRTPVVRARSTTLRRSCGALETENPRSMREAAKADAVSAASPVRSSAETPEWSERKSSRAPARKKAAKDTLAAMRSVPFRGGSASVFGGSKRRSERSRRRRASSRKASPSLVRVTTRVVR